MTHRASWRPPTLFHDGIQTVHGPFLLLPQRGARPVDRCGRPLNAWAIRRAGYAILVDAAFSWALDGVALLADGGAPPWAVVLTDDGVAARSDALVDLAEGYTAPVFLHAADGVRRAASTAAELAGLAYREPAGDAFFRRAGLEIVAMPERARSAVMVWCATEGVLVVGDGAVGRGPCSARDAACIARVAPMDAAGDAALRERWREIVRVLDPRVVLPLRGRAVGDGGSGTALLANLWEGDADSDALRPPS